MPWIDSIQIPFGGLPNGAWPQLSLLRLIPPVLVEWIDAIQVPHKSLPNGSWPQLSLVRSIAYTPPARRVGGGGYLWMQWELERRKKKREAIEIEADNEEVAKLLIKWIYEHL